MVDNTENMPTNLQRRTLLTSAALGAGSVLLQATMPKRAHAASTPDQGMHALTAQTTEGPYYLPLDLVRADITEGLAGIPLEIALTVLDEEGKPYRDALVDVWHCDAQGVYSGYANQGPPGTASDTQGKTFLRGTQPVGADGVALFHSIYPGWYQGRTTHIHFKVKRGTLVNLTSQFFLPDTLSEYLYTQVSAYRRASLRDTLNSTDGIAIDAGQTVEGNVREAQGRYIAALTVRVSRTANPPIDRPAPPTGQPPAMEGPQGGHRPGPFPMPQALQGQARTAALLPDAPRKANPAPPLPPGREQMRHEGPR